MHHLRNRMIFPYIVLLTLLSGPALNSIIIKELQLYHVIIPMAISLIFFRFCRYQIINRNVFYVCLLFLLFLLTHLENGLIRAESLDRLFIYLFYFSFTFACFLITVFYVKLIGVDRALKLLALVMNISLLVMSLEFIFNTPVYGHVGSFLMANVNNQIATVILLASVFLLAGKIKRYLIYAGIIFILAIFADARLGALSLGLQLFFVAMFFLENRFKYYLLIFIGFCLFLFLLTDFSQDLILVLEAIYNSFLNPTAIIDIVEGGEGSSISVRMYTVLEMFKGIVEGDILVWLFGYGAGQLNITIPFTRYDIISEYYSPHFFYIEVFYYYGLSFYIFYYVILRLLNPNLVRIRNIFIISPSLFSIVLASSAVYLIPLYVFLGYYVIIVNNNLKDKII
jgi:hypothetical protein